MNNLPTDEQVSEWFDLNIEKDCSASSAIYKFRLWLKEFSTPLDKEGYSKEELSDEKIIEFLHGLAKVVGEQFLNDDSFNEPAKFVREFISSLLPLQKDKEEMTDEMLIDFSDWVETSQEAADYDKRNRVRFEPKMGGNPELKKRKPELLKLYRDRLIKKNQQLKK